MAARAVPKILVGLTALASGSLRAAPASEAAIVSAAPRGRVVLGPSPGGWIDLGNGQAALGWVHPSRFGRFP